MSETSTEEVSNGNYPSAKKDTDGYFQVSIRIRETGFRRWQLASVLRAVAIHVRRLPDCLSCHLYEDLSENGDLLLLEDFASRSAAENHLQSGALDQIRQLTDPEVGLLEARVLRDKSAEPNR